MQIFIHSLLQAHFLRAGIGSTDCLLAFHFLSVYTFSSLSTVPSSKQGGQKSPPLPIHT